jgi:hypothetical protein
MSVNKNVTVPDGKLELIDGSPAAILIHQPCEGFSEGQNRF